MPLDTQTDKWQNASKTAKNQNTNKTGITAETVIDALSDLDSDKAYSTVELYSYIHEGDIEAIDNVDSDELRSFVPIYSNITTKQGNLTQATKNEHGLGDDAEIHRRKADDGGYEAWYFRLSGV